ncbi:MAG: aspartate aminotransferase family protein [Actinobacteria bacterium]|nr:aspartate aminotransferase family protein [Actinomycetota bacterium]
MDQEGSAFAPLPLDWETSAVAERRRRFLSPALASFVAYDEPVVWRRGEGQYVWDNEGRRYLDCMAQNVCISVGHAHPGVLSAVHQQMRELPHVTTAYHHPQPGHFAEELVATLPDGPDWVAHFVNSGAEAVDLAVLLARAHTRNYELLALRDAYHGMHYGAQTATGIGQARQLAPPAPGYVQVMAPHSYRGPLGPDAGPYLEELGRTIHTNTCGAVAGLIAEPIQGYGGIVEMPPDYLRGAAELVRAAGGLLLVDEVQAGVARTGDHFWGFEAHGVVPDVIILSKGIGNGFPLAAVVTRREVAESMAARMFFNTYGANPTCCAAGRAVLRAIEQEGLQDNARLVGGRILRGLRTLQERYPRLGDVRGRGLLIGTEIVADPTTREADAAAAARVQLELLARGMVVGLCGREHNVVKINPPLCATEADAAALLEAMDAALTLAL